MKNLMKNLLAAFAVFWPRFLRQLEAWGSWGYAVHVIPSLAELQQYNVNRPDAVEAIKQGLYDNQILHSSSTETLLTFFQTPLGSGTSATVGSGAKTLADTNLEAAGALPAPKSFLVQTIELFCFPGSGVSADSTTIASAKNIADMYAFAKAGWLELFVGSKAYLDEGPLVKFPPRSGLTGQQVGADSTANTGVRVDYASMGGPVYELDPPILLVPTQNFKITLNWGAAITLNANLLIWVNLGGILYRNSQ